MLSALARATCILVAASIVSPASARTVLERRAADAVGVMRGTLRAENVFTTSFLAEVPAAQLAALTDRLRAASGDIEGAADFRAHSTTTILFTIRFASAEAEATLTIEREVPNKVTGFRIGPAMPIDDSIDRIAAEFAELPGEAGFLVARLDADGVTALHARQADAQFAIGSTFKLWVLDTLAAGIEAGRLRWDQVVTLGPRSLPGGITQDWPPGAALTVETLATLMISRSDNTATDTLIHLIGRPRIEAHLRALGHSDPACALPLLTTAESFALKLSPHALRDAYAIAGDTAQARILAKLDPYRVIAETDLRALDDKPISIDSAGWFASPQDVAGILDSLRRRNDPRVLQILAIAPDLPAGLRDRFAYAGYKGGSEVGVLNLTWLLRSKAGGWLAVTASWNDKTAAVDLERLTSLAQRLVRLAGPALPQDDP